MPSAKTIHVAVNGSDTWSGMLAQPNAKGTDGPVASPLAALAAARRTGVRRIRIEAGEYFGVHLELTAADSGLHLEAAPGARVVLYGGVRISHWEKDGRFLAALPPGGGDFRSLVANGRLAPRARLPETGAFRHESTFDGRWMSSTAGGWNRPPTTEELTHLRYCTEDLDPWLDVHNAELTIFHCWDESLVGLAAVDREQHVLTFANPAGHPPGAFGNWQEQANTYVVWNVREGLTKPGQWYLDRTAGKVVYWPLPDEHPANLTVVAPTDESIITIRGTEPEPVTGIAISGLVLAGTNTPLKAGGFGANFYAGAVEGEHLTDCRIEWLTVQAVNGHGLRFSGFQDLLVDRCHICDTGAGGIYCRNGDGLTLTNNHVHHVGRAFPSGIGINASAKRAVIRHNDIHDTTYSGMTCGGCPDGDVSYNRFARVMEVLKDGGGIYFFAGKGTHIHHNVIRDIASSLGHAYYIDEQGENCVVENNLAVNCVWPSHNHMSRNCTIRNNVFINTGPMKISLMRSHEFTFGGNVLLADGPITILGPPDALAAMPNNLLYSAVGEYLRETSELEGYARNQVAPLAAIDGTRLVDPQIVDRDSEKIRFAPDSPAAALEIGPQDFTPAGRQPQRPARRSGKPRT